MIGLIVARSKNNVIGRNGEIPWKIKGEQKQFWELTTGNVVVMGRKSYEEIGYPLPNRKILLYQKVKPLQAKILLQLVRCKRRLIFQEVKMFTYQVDMDCLKKHFHW